MSDVASYRAASNVRALSSDAIAIGTTAAAHSYVGRILPSTPSTLTVSASVIDGNMSAVQGTLSAVQPRLAVAEERARLQGEGR